LTFSCPANKPCTIKKHCQGLCNKMVNNQNRFRGKLTNKTENCFVTLQDSLVQTTVVSLRKTYNISMRFLKQKLCNKCGVPTDKHCFYKIEVMTKVVRLFSKQGVRPLRHYILSLLVFGNILTSAFQRFYLVNCHTMGSPQTTHQLFSAEQ